MSKARPPVLRRYFFDTEFNEHIPEPFGVDFISLAIVGGRDRAFYGVHKDFNRAAAAENAWLNYHVVAKLPPEEEWVDLERIRQGVLDAIEPAYAVELWSKCGSYDNFILCRLFGSMNGLRDELYKIKGIEKVIFRDTNDLRRHLGWPKLPEVPEQRKHDALVDAWQERAEFNQLLKIGRRRHGRHWQP